MSQTAATEVIAIDELIEFETRDLYHCRVCAPAGFQREVVVRAVNIKAPVEELRRWHIPKSALVANPQVCPTDPARFHWLLVR